MSDEDRYAPSIFMSDYDWPKPYVPVNRPLPRGAEGGVIEVIKRAVVTAVREGFTGVGMHVLTHRDRVDDRHNELPDNHVYIDLEYPVEQLHYPGVWVQFSLTGLNRSGVSHEQIVKHDGQWCTVQEFEVRGRLTFAVVALTNRDRDRVSDHIIAMLSFSRHPQAVLTDPQRDAKQLRSLHAALADNPHIAMSLVTDSIYPIGQNTNIGTPWDGEQLAYEDGYAVDMIGHYNILHRHDGTYTLTRVDVASQAVYPAPTPPVSL